MPKPMRRKPMVLFVDDEKYVHGYEREIAKRLGLRARHAFSPAEAEPVFWRRINAIDRLSEKKLAQLKKTKDSGQRKLLQRQLLFLTRLKRKPFSLIVSDINMPRGIPTGFDFASGLKESFPGQKILMHSDDTHFMDLLNQRQGIQFSPKRGYTKKGRPKKPTRRLAKAIESQIKKKRE